MATETIQLETHYRVLIADDEPIIREGLRDCIDWTTLGLEVVGEAEDGEEALELAIKLNADILLVDMNMPFLNGIELIRRLQEKCPQCRFLIVSGHDEFSYAQAAVRLGVDDYILKPVQPTQLNDALARLRQRMDEERKRLAYVKQAEGQIERNIPLLRQRFCLEWLEGQLTRKENFEQEITERLLFLGLPSTPPNYIGVVRWPMAEASQTIMSENDRQLFLFAIENIIEELVAPTPFVLFRQSNGLIGVCLWGQITDDLDSSIEQHVLSYLNIAIHVHFEHYIGDLEGVSDLYRKCRERIYDHTQLSPLVRRARGLIQANYADRNLTLEQLASRLQVSSVYLSRVLKKELNDSFVTLMTKARIRKAIQLLDTTTLPIHEIAERVGYDTQHYFSTAFKKTVGVSPAQYRKSSGTEIKSL